jgi:hypothetical protein
MPAFEGDEYRIAIKRSKYVHDHPETDEDLQMLAFSTAVLCMRSNDLNTGAYGLGENRLGSVPVSGQRRKG